MNDRPYKYKSGEWGRKARKALNNQRRAQIKADTRKETQEALKRAS